MDTPAPKLVLVGRLLAHLGAPQDVGAAQFGKRNIFPVTGGEYEGFDPKGPKKAEVLPGGADWAVMTATHVELDVRITLKSDDGALFYVSYFGKLPMNEKIGASLAAGVEGKFGDSAFLTNPRFETGDARYSWMNAAFFVGQGRLLGHGKSVEYRVYRVDV